MLSCNSTTNLKILVHRELVETSPDSHPSSPPEELITAFNSDSSISEQSRASPVPKRETLRKPRAPAHIQMTLTETLAWGLGLLAFARLVLAPLGDYFTRRHAAADPWNPT